MTLTQTAPAAASTIATVAGAVFSGAYSAADGAVMARITIHVYRHTPGHVAEVSAWQHSEKAKVAQSQSGTYSIPLPRLTSDDYCWSVSILDSNGTTSDSVADRPVFTLSSTAPVLSTPSPADLSTVRTLNGVTFSAAWTDAQSYRPIRGHIQMQVTGRSWLPADLLWDADFEVPVGQANPAVQYGGQSELAADTYDWRMYAVNEIGEQSNTITQSITLSQGFETTPGIVTKLHAGERRPARWRIVIRDILAPPTASNVVPFGSSYKYKVESQDHDTGFEAPAFDDSSWATGVGGFGYNDPLEVTTIKLNGAQIATTWTDPTPSAPTNTSDNSDLTLRKTITWPNGAPVMRFTYGIDDEVWFYVDGVQVGHFQNHGPSQRTDFTLTVTAPSPGSHVVAVRARNKKTTFPLWTNSAFFEMKIDALLSAAATYQTPMSLVQSAIYVGGAGGGTSTFASPVTTGNAILTVQGNRNHTFINPKLNNSVGATLPMTVSSASLGGDTINIGYRISTSNEQTLYWGNADVVGVAYEFAGVTQAQLDAFTGGTASGFGTTRPDGNLTGGAAHFALMGVITDQDFDGTNGEAAGTGWTLDEQHGAGNDTTLHPHMAMYHVVTPAAGLAATSTGPAHSWVAIRAEFVGNVGGWSQGIAALASRGPGNIAAIIENANNVGVAEYYNAGGTLHFTLPTLDPQCPNINPYQSHWSFQMYRGEGWKELNAGLIIDYDTTENDTIFYGADYLGVLGLMYDERFNPKNAADAVASLWPTDPALHPDDPGQISGSKYVGNTITEIVTDQLERAVNAPNSPLGFISVGSIASMTETTTVFVTLAQRLPFIIAMLDSHKAGTGHRTRLRVKKNTDDTYSFEVQENPGNQRPDLRMEYGGLIQGYRAVPFGNFATRVLALGRQTNGLELSYTIANTPLPVGETDADFNVTTYGNIPQINMWQDIADINDLKRRAANYAARVGAIGKQLGLGIRTNLLSVKDDWDITDSIPVVIKRGKLDTTTMGQGYWTVWGWQLDILPNTEVRPVLSLLPYIPEVGADSTLAVTSPVQSTPAFTYTTTDPTTNDQPSGPGTWVNSNSGHIWTVDPTTGFWTDETAAGGPEFPRFRALPIPGIYDETPEQGEMGLQGPQGPQGIPGVPGLGIPGFDGEDGTDGFPGSRGDTGATGATGSTGATGATGPQGVPGFPGEDGENADIAIVSGPTGAAGAAGRDGVGVPGADGEDAMVDIIPGPVGPTGATGSRGDNGVPGFDGDDADNMVLPIAQGTNVTGDIQPNSVTIGGAAGLRLWMPATSGQMQLDSDGGAVQTRLILQGTSGQNSTLALNIAGESFDRATLEGDATAQAIAFGPGSAAKDLLFARAAAGSAKLSSASAAVATQLLIEATSGQTTALGLAVAGDSTSRTVLFGDNSAIAITFGSGSASRDVFIGRNGAKDLWITSTQAGANLSRILLGGRVALGGSVNTTLAASANNWNPTNFTLSSFIRVTSVAASVHVTGMLAGNDGDILYVVNAQPTNTITWDHGSASSLAANRISCPNAVAFVQAIRATVAFIYSASDSLWYLVGPVA